MFDRSGPRDRDDERPARHGTAPADRERGGLGPSSILALQRTAGNAAVARVVARASGGQEATAPPKPPPDRTRDFLNSYTPLYRALLEKVESGSQLDRIELDTLRELRAEANLHGLRNLVADCDELIARARERGVVMAPEEHAPAAESTPPEPKVDIDAATAAIVSAAVAVIVSAAVAVIKESMRKERRSADNWRGGRLHETYGSVEFVLYELDDMLLTRHDANAIEAAMRRVARQSPPGLDLAALWQIVAQLYHQNVPVRDTVAMLEIYATPPTTVNLYQHWWRQVLAEPPEQRMQEALDESAPAESGASKRQRPRQSEDLLHMLMRRNAEATGTAYSEPMRALKRLEREREKLSGQHKQHVQHENAQLIHNELLALRERLNVLHRHARSVNSLLKSGKFTKLLALDVETIKKAIEHAYRAEARLRKKLEELNAQEELKALEELKVLEELEANQAEIDQMMQEIKGPHPKEEKATASTAPRKGGDDGVWDAGFSEDELSNWIANRVNRSINSKNVKDCVAYIRAHPGSGGGTGTYCGGLPVFHISHGKKDSTDGCTVFFTHAPDGTITIVGIGSHSSKYSVAYTLEWYLDGWTRGSWAGNTLIIKR